VDQRDQVAPFGREVDAIGENLGEEVVHARQAARVHLRLVPEPTGGRTGNREAVEVEVSSGALRHRLKPANHGVGQAVADMEGADGLLVARCLADAVERAWPSSVAPQLLPADDPPHLAGALIHEDHHIATAQADAVSRPVVDPPAPFFAGRLLEMVTRESAGMIPSATAASFARANARATDITKRSS
jgi:hypothetical protein